MTTAAIADATGLRSSSGRRSTWAELGVDPVAGNVRFAAIFGSAFPGFRRLDIFSRMLVVASEACDLDRHLPEALRTDTALVSGSQTGCLAADRRFERSLHTEAGIEPAVFPYTLPSTGLGEVAIRHRLHGPTISLSLAGGDAAQPLQTAERLLLCDEASAVVVLIGDWVPASIYATDQKTRAAALLLRPADPDTPHLVAVADLTTSQGADLFETIENRLLPPPAPWTP